MYPYRTYILISTLSHTRGSLVKAGQTHLNSVQYQRDSLHHFCVLNCCTSTAASLKFGNIVKYSQLIFVESHGPHDCAMCP